MSNGSISELLENLPEDYEIISEPSSYSNQDFQRTIYDSRLVSAVFDILGFKTAIHLQSCFDGNEVDYLNWFMQEKKFFRNKSPAEVALEGKGKQIRIAIGRMDGIYS